MKIEAGQQIGPYEILSLAGSGGMGEVYRARDPRIGRDVAIKVLPAAFSENHDRMQRFEQEARSAGMLNHANLLTIYDIGTHDGSPYIVAEFLEGETLRERLNAGRTLRSGSSDSGSAIPTRKAIEWAQQLSAGVAAAHERGIVHRDLKPENIFLTRDGRVKILDFGLAKLTQPAAESGMTEEKTQHRGTDPGTVLGTAGYMSPEQVRGQPVDHRSDIFSLGAILHEMFTGQRAFRGDSSADTMSAILREDPPAVSSLNPNVTPGMNRVVHHCLEKNPEERFQSARDLAFDLASLSTDSTASHSIRRTPSFALLSVVLGIAAALALGLLGGWFAAKRSTAPRLLPRTRLLTYSGHDSSPALSPDGKTIVFSSDRDGRKRIWLKELASGGEVPLTTGSDDLPRFSPDGSTIIFIRTENSVPSLYRTAVVGGTPRRLMARVMSADFTPDGRQILFVAFMDRSGVGTKIGLSAADGSRAAIIASHPRVLAHPRCSPDGKWAAFADGTPGNAIGSTAWLLDMTSRKIEPIRLPKGFGVASSVAWVDATHVIYGLNENVTGFPAGAPQRFFVQEVGDSEAVPILSGPAGQIVEAAGKGRIIYDGFNGRENLREISIANTGSGRWLSHGNAVDRQPAYSPDGKWIAFSSNRSGDLDVWAMNRENGTVIRLTDDSAEDYDPGYSPDGTHLLWSSNRGGNFEIWIAETDGSGARQVSHDGVDAENPTVTRDGQWVVYNSYNQQRPGVFKVRIDGSSVQQLYRGSTELPETSPDGQWAAFHGINENQLLAVNLNTDKVIKIASLATRSTATATGRCRWRPDGKAIAFVDRAENSVGGLRIQDFDPAADTSSSLRWLLGPGLDEPVESFGFSPDGLSVTAGFNEQLDGIYSSDNLALIPR
jgi:serine/threonine protein kinase